MPNFPANSRPAENLASQQATVRLVPKDAHQNVDLFIFHNFSHTGYQGVISVRRLARSQQCDRCLLLPVCPLRQLIPFHSCSAATSPLGHFLAPTYAVSFFQKETGAPTAAAAQLVQGSFFRREETLSKDSLLPVLAHAS
jgi:hypothetical protein